MTPCECCGNTYDKAFEISIGGTTHTFDSFECAIQTLAPRCLHCKVPIIGHGIEARGQYFCCAHCARWGGVSEVVDRAPEAASAAGKTDGNGNPHHENLQVPAEWWTTGPAGEAVSEA